MGVTLTIAVMSGGSIDRPALLGRVTGALKLSAAEAQARIDELAVARLLAIPDVDGSPVSVTDAGGELHTRIRSAVAEITKRLWGDLPADELETAARVLGIVLERANAELAEA